LIRPQNIYIYICIYIYIYDPAVRSPAPVFVFPFFFFMFYLQSTDRGSVHPRTARRFPRQDGILVRVAISRALLHTAVAAAVVGSYPRSPAKSFPEPPPPAQLDLPPSSILGAGGRGVEPL
jgi:hypothetical protein